MMWAQRSALSGAVAIGVAQLVAGSSIHRPRRCSPWAGGHRCHARVAEGLGDPRLRVRRQAGAPRRDLGRAGSIAVVLGIVSIRRPRIGPGVAVFGALGVAAALGGPAPLRPMRSRDGGALAGALR
jgi:hypothetical protein